jgi:hypothetical protein
MDNPCLHAHTVLVKRDWESLQIGFNSESPEWGEQRVGAMSRLVDCHAKTVPSSRWHDEQHPPAFKANVARIVSISK